MLAIFIRSDLI